MFLLLIFALQLSISSFFFFLFSFLKKGKEKDRERDRERIIQRGRIIRKLPKGSCNGTGSKTGLSTSQQLPSSWGRVFGCNKIQNYAQAKIQKTVIVLSQHNALFCPSWFWLVGFFSAFSNPILPTVSFLGCFNVIRFYPLTVLSRILQLLPWHLIKHIFVDDSKMPGKH